MNMVKHVKMRLAVWVLGCSAAWMCSATTLDTVVFGDSGSETAHALVSESTTSFTGALSEPARCCNPLNPVDYYGGTLTVTMTVDPVRRNYFSVKLWSNDDTSRDIGRIYLYLPEGDTDYQVGFRHEGDYMPLSVPIDHAGVVDRFFYSTTMLPLEMTRGKTSITLKLVSMGRLYGLGSGGEKDGGNYQFLMDTDSRGIYRAYTHVDPYLNVAGETQGSAPATTVRPSPGEETLRYNGSFYTYVKNRINDRLSTSISSDSSTFVSTFSVDDVAFLARSYSVSGLSGETALPGYQNTAVVTRVVALLDAFAQSYYEDSSRAQGWGGAYGALGQAIFFLQDYQDAQLLTSTILDTVVDDGDGGSKTRREAWGDMLYASREYGRLSNRRTISNQAILADGNIYSANKGLQGIGDSRAFSEEVALRYVKEACGLLPWQGVDLPDSNGNGLPDDGSERPYGDNYYQVTADGQTREWGYVGAGYGDLAYHVADWARMSGDPDVLQQMAKMAKARAPFRRPTIEVDGSSHYQTMESVGLLSWRGAHESDGEFAGYIAYGSSANTGAGPKGMMTAARSGDSALIGYAKQMLEDNQYFTYLYSKYAKTTRALDLFEDYEAVRDSADSGIRLPMTDGQPDFAWADEGNRILALKHGDDRLWITPYWEAKTGTGINGVARFQYDTPSYTQYGVLQAVPQFTFGGSFTRTTDDIDKPEGFQWTPPEPRPLQAYGGEILPLGPTPADASSDAPFRGKADFYAFRFGRYLMGINASEDHSYSLKPPVGFTSATDLISSDMLSGAITIAPTSSVALVLEDTVDPAPIPVAPLYLGVSNGGSGIALSWPAASGAEDYTVLRSVTSGGPYTIQETGITEQSWSDTDVATGQTYYYKVIAANQNGESYPSCERSVMASTVSDAISFNLTPSGSTTMTAAHFAGAPGVRVANWNMLSGGTLSSGIVDGGGQSVSGISATLSTGSGGSLGDRSYATGDDVSMIGTVLDQFNGTPSTVTVSGIPFPSYDVYCYVYDDESSSGANDRGGSFTVGSTTYYLRTGSDTTITSSDGSGYIRSSDTSLGSGMDVELGNYVVFTNLSGNLSVSMVAEDINGGAQRLKVSGFQIVQSSGDQVAAPDTPDGLVATASQSGQIDLSWSAASGALGYNVKRSFVSDGPYTLVDAGVVGTGFSDSGLTDGEAVYYVVSANSTGGESADSGEAGAVPSAPITEGEYRFDGYQLVGDANFYMTVSNSVAGHLYQLMATEQLVPADWQPEGGSMNGSGSNIWFDIPVSGSDTNRFFKLDVQRM
jgi:fibronectin type 3 domain-containing protein